MTVSFTCGRALIADPSRGLQPARTHVRSTWGRGLMAGCRPAQRTLLLLFVAGAVAATGCSPSEPNRLSELRTVHLTIGEKDFELWVADTYDTQAKGLMYITAEEMAPLPDGTERGMIFVFNRSVRDSFWMKNTIIPLDIAYVDTAGKVVNTYTMAPLDTRSGHYRPDGPYRYAIEVNAHRLAELGIGKGDVLQIPASVLKRTH